MRRLPVLPAFAALIFAVSLVTGALALAGCQTSPINGRAVLPASVADVDAVQADVDALRTDTRTSIDAVKTDLTAAKIDTTATGAALGSLDGKIEEAKNRPPTAGVGGGIINALGGELPPWLDLILSIGGPLLGLNYARNRTRKPALAKVKSEAIVASTGKAPPPSTV